MGDSGGSVLVDEKAGSVPSCWKRQQIKAKLSLYDDEHVALALLYDNRVKARLNNCLQTD